MIYKMLYEQSVSNYTNVSLYAVCVWITKNNYSKLICSRIGLNWSCYMFVIHLKEPVPESNVWEMDY